MYKHFYLLITFSFFITNAFSQPISIADSATQVVGSASPCSPQYDYTYGQTVYLESEIQGSGLITALTYYYMGHSLSNSDSLLIFMRQTSQKGVGYGTFFLTDSMKVVFSGKLRNYIIPGPVTITLDTPFYYGGSGNLVIAVNEKSPGSDFTTTADTPYFKGFVRRLNNQNRNDCWYDLNQIDPYVAETKPPFTYISASGSGLIANVTFHGLTSLSCQSPKRVRFSNINHNNAKVVWAAPWVGTAPGSYELYFSTDQTDPTAATTISFTNITDTFKVITGLQPTTNYKVWLRSSCGTSLKSVWTLVDSFTTICAPIPVPTPAEPFTTWLPNCWTMAEGTLTTNSKLNYNSSTIFGDQPWLWRKWINQSSSSNYAPITYFVGSAVDSTNAWLISPPYNLGNTGNTSLEFDLALTKTNSSQQGFLDTDDKFIVVISTDNGTTWSSANIIRQWVYPTFIASAGQHIVIPLSSYSGLVRFGFYARSIIYTTPTTNLFIDNVQLTGVLPVTLLSFAGKKDGPINLLQWRTATEQNNRGFELQKSANGIEFSSIGFVATKANGGNSTGQLSYQYTDKKPLSAGGYYRLKQVDFDGKFSYSKIVFIKGEGVTQLSIASLYPNPTHQLLNAVLEAPIAQRVQLVIADLAGKVVMQQTMELQKGANNTAVNVASLAKGVYVVKVVCANGCEAAVSKFVKE